MMHFLSDLSKGDLWTIYLGLVMGAAVLAAVTQLLTGTAVAILAVQTARRGWQQLRSPQPPQKTRGLLRLLAVGGGAVWLGWRVVAQQHAAAQHTRQQQQQLARQLQESARYRRTEEVKIARNAAHYFQQLANGLPDSASAPLPAPTEQQWQATLATRDSAARASRQPASAQGSGW